jgi:hypothetical protein
MSSSSGHSDSEAYTEENMTPRRKMLSAAAENEIQQYVP